MSEKDNNAKSNTPLFSLDDVEEILQKQTSTATAESEVKTQDSQAQSKTKKKEVAEGDIQIKKQRLSAVSAMDILGFSPDETPETTEEKSEKDVPKKFLPYYRMLIDLRNHVLSGLDYHTQETLHRSAKDDSGDISSYGQHMGDAGTESFDRDFALSLVSSEKEALHEIQKAIERIFDGTYGICKITGKPINKERLKAVPFTRFSVEGQEEFERTQKKTIQRGGVFVETVEDTAAFTSDDDSDE